MIILRVNFNIPDELINRLDDYAKKNYTSRSSVMCQACDQFLTAKEMQMFFSDMRKAIQKISETQTVDEETQKKFDEFEALYKAFCGSFNG